MSRIVVLSVILASLSTIVGCGASAGSARTSTTAASVNVAESRDESSWNPPEEIAMSIKDSAPAAAPAPRRVRKEPFRPNGGERPSRGAVHAATY